jgi:hypothetical protein
VPAGDQIPVPVQDGLGADQQPHSAQDVTGQWVQQGGEPGAVCPGEPYALPVQLPFQDRDLVPQGEDLGVFVAVAHGQQPQQGDGVGYAEVGQSKQHSQSSSRSACG